MGRAREVSTVPKDRAKALAAALGPTIMDPVVADGAAINEEALVSQAQGGSLEAFSSLVEMYQERAIHAANSFVGNFEDARDIAQDAFVKAYQNLARFEGQSRFYTWFYRILVNSCKDFLRKKKLRRTVSFWTRDEKGDERDGSEAIVSPEATAVETALSRELGAKIHAALERLPFQQRSAFTLRYLEGLSMEEIAETMGLSVGAVKAHLWQGGQKMKKQLKEYRQTGEGTT